MAWRACRRRQPSWCHAPACCCLIPTPPIAFPSAPRPGLLVDVVSVLKDINVNVVSAEIDTIGNEARDEFFVTYHGEPLNGPMVQLVTNSLQVRARGGVLVG